MLLGAGVQTSVCISAFTIVGILSWTQCHGPLSWAIMSSFSLRLIRCERVHRHVGILSPVQLVHMWVPYLPHRGTMSHVYNHIHPPPDLFLTWGNRRSDLHFQDVAVVKVLFKWDDKGWGDGLEGKSICSASMRTRVLTSAPI